METNKAKPNWFLNKDSNHNDIKYIIADDSPLRLKYLDLIGIYPKIVKSTFQVEKLNDIGLTPAVLAKVAAEQKAHDVDAQMAKANEKYDIVLAFHTITVMDNTIIPKPKNHVEAILTLKSFSGRAHTVFTGVAIYHNSSEKCDSFVSETKVQFCDIYEEMFQDDIISNFWTDNDAGYDVDQEGSVFIKEIDGCFYNIMGIPISALVKNVMKLMNENKRESSATNEKATVPCELKFDDLDPKDFTTKKFVPKVPIHDYEEETCSIPEIQKDSFLSFTEPPNAKLYDQYRRIENGGPMASSNYRNFDFEPTMAEHTSNICSSDELEELYIEPSNGRQRAAKRKNRIRGGRGFNGFGNRGADSNRGFNQDPSTSNHVNSFATKSAVPVVKEKLILPSPFRSVPMVSLSKDDPSVETANDKTHDTDPSAEIGAPVYYIPSKDFPKYANSFEFPLATDENIENLSFYTSCFLRTTGRLGFADMKRLGIPYPPKKPFDPKHSYPYCNQDDWG